MYMHTSSVYIYVCMHTYLIRSRVIGFCVAHYNQSQHRTAIEYPRRETEEVYQRVYRSIQDHGGRDNRLYMENKIEQ